MCSPSNTGNASNMQTVASAHLGSLLCLCLFLLGSLLCLCLFLLGSLLCLCLCLFLPGSSLYGTCMCSASNAGKCSPWRQQPVWNMHVLNQQCRQVLTLAASCASASFSLLALAATACKHYALAEMAQDQTAKPQPTSTKDAGITSLTVIVSNSRSPYFNLAPRRTSFLTSCLM